MSLSHLAHANLIRVFDFYLAAMFVLSLYRRFSVYVDTVQLAISLHTKYPRLASLLKNHKNLFLTGDVLRPTAVVAGLMATQFLLSRVVYPQATITVGGVTEVWWRVLSLACSTLPMVAVDCYFLVRVARIDRPAAEQYLTRAEHWLKSWKGPVIRKVTFGFLNPLEIVNSEVRKAMSQLSQTTRLTFWWIALQVACRMGCGLTIWGLWWSK